MSENTKNSAANLSSHVVGTVNDDVMEEGYQDANGNEIGGKEGSNDKVNGNAGSDTITTDEGSDLAAGDMVGEEWQFVDGKWVFDASKIKSDGSGLSRDYDDVISTGAGDDVLIGNGGNDILNAGAGDDIVIAGRGDDRAFGGTGDDVMHLEAGNDYAEGGDGDDIINGGAGNDVIYGDNANDNLLGGSDNATSFAQFGESGAWTHSEEDGTISQTVSTNVDETYEISFEIAANLDGGHISGMVEVLWNGEVVGTVDTNSGGFEEHSIMVKGTGGDGALTFRSIEPEPDPDAPVYDFSGPVVSYEATMDFGDGPVTVDAFAPGQAKLYQVIDGQLKVFDIEEREYVDAGPAPGFKVNAIGFNTETNTIYGVAKSNGFDSLGNPVSSTDIVMMDANGATYRVGEGFYGDYVGDFDDSGNLWTFHTSLNRVSKVDVDNLDAEGDPVITHYDLPNNLFKDRTYDLAFNSQDGNFYAVVSPGKNGEAGKVVKIDMSDVENGGVPTFAELPITGTLYGDEMASGMAKGAYGAVFMDGDGNLFYGLNKGDHDLGMFGEAGTSGAIFKVNMDWQNNQAYSEFMSEAQATGSNDGTVDPRSFDAFAEVDTGATVLIRNPEMKSIEGGNDDLRGGTGDDIIFGNGGDDTMHGGEGDDTMSGDFGNDNMMGGTGNDTMSGGTGDDKIQGQAGHDTIDGGDGKDYIHAGDGNDTIMGGAGNDKLVGGKGADVIEGGAGNDHMWGGNWWKDGSSDTFVISAGGGKDMIHDFEVGTDRLDLSSYGLEFSDIQAAMSDKGWATEIDLSKLTGGEGGDKLILKNVDAEDLDESAFIL